MRITPNAHKLPTRLKIMGYLRGTGIHSGKSALAKRVTLQNQITSLQRQVNRNKAETQYFSIYGNANATTTSPEQVNHLVTDTLINSSDFRTRITGDQWINKSLNFRLQIHSKCTALRYVIYVPKKSGNRFIPTSYKFVQQPDPTAFWVLSDRCISRNTVNYGSSEMSQHVSLNVSLKNLGTQFNSESSVLERGDIVIAIISDGDTGLRYDYAYQLTYCNK